MKCAIAIVLFYAMSFAIGQDIVDQFGYSSTFCSGTYYLYSDSSFVHERGCEERSSITLGSYVLKADTLYLHPKRFEEINFISSVEYLDLDTSNYVTTNYVALNNRTVEADTKYTSIENANRWINGKMSTDSLEDHKSVKFNFEIYGYDFDMTEDYSFFFERVRLTSDTLGACPVELERLTRKRTCYHLPPEINEIRIRLELPYETIVQMINFELVYEDLEPGPIKCDSRIIKIEYN